MPNLTVIDALLGRYLAANPGYRLPNGNTHPAALALSTPVKNWICDQIGIERYWRHMLSGAKVWFEHLPDPTVFKYFCLQFEAEGNIFWHNRPEFSDISERYGRWRAQIALAKASKPKPLHGSA